jgi:hypothetical protein
MTTTSKRTWSGTKAMLEATDASSKEATSFMMLCW